MVTARACRTGLPAPAVLLLVLLLTSCAPANTAVPSPPSTSTATGAGMGVGTGATTPAPPTAAPAVSADDSSWDASGPSSGVDRAEWPDTEKGAKALLAALPEELGGESLELRDPRDHSPGADYGTLGTVFVQTEEHQEGPDRLTAYQLLISGFGLGAVCAEGTHRGTAGVPVLRKGEQAALAEAAPGVQDGSTPAWFSCEPITEDDEWGHAVGWTSGTTAWQVYARDEKAARTVVTALHEAAG